jgi:hypothetical protein
MSVPQGQMAGPIARELDAMSPFAQVTDADLARARDDPAFRQELLRQSLEALLAGILKTHGAESTQRTDTKARQIREGVELAVRLSEILQSPTPSRRGR